MKKVIAGVLIGLSVLGIGCNETIVLDENTKVNQELKVVDVKETPIEVFEDFVFLGFKDENILGMKYPFFEEENQDKSIYTVDKDGKVSESGSDVELMVTTEIGNAVSYGVDGIVEDHNDGEFYYKDTFNNISFKLDGYKELTDKYRYSESYYLRLSKMINNDNYFTIIITKHGKESKQGFLEISPDEQQVIIIDIENEKIYYKKENDEGRRVVPGEEDSIKRYENIVQSLYYDENLNSIMSINYDGKVNKINFSGDNIVYQPYKKLNLKGYQINNAGGLDSRKLSDDKIIICMNPPEDSTEIPFVSAIYDIKSGEVTPFEEGMYAFPVGGRSIITAFYKEEIYLAQIKEDNSVEFLYKFNSENYNCVNAFGMINEAGDRIFIRKKVYDGEREDIGYDSSKMRDEFSFIDLIEK